MPVGNLMNPMHDTERYCVTTKVLSGRTHSSITSTSGWRDQNWSEAIRWGYMAVDRDLLQYSPDLKPIIDTCKCLNYESYPDLFASTGAFGTTLLYNLRTNAVTIASTGGID
jgi:hypothetical protein